MILFTQCSKKRKKKKKRKERKTSIQTVRKPFANWTLCFSKNWHSPFLIIFSPPIQAVYSTSGYSWWNGVCGDWLEWNNRNYTSLPGGSCLHHSMSLRHTKLPAEGFKATHIRVFCDHVYCFCWCSCSNLKRIKRTEHWAYCRAHD